jgi:ubiquinone/menaquinone biosynthesis C-methylase UbiE
MKETATHAQTAEWYKDYYSRKGSSRNDLLADAGVLFQTFAYQKSIVEALRTLPVERGWNVLDVGCGAGGSLVQFLSYGFTPNRLYGIDVDPERIRAGRERLPGVSFVCSDASSIGFESAFFDMVMESTLFIQLVDDDLARRVANEMVRVAKPLGYIVLIDWRYSYRHPEYKAVSRKRIADLFAVGTKTRVHCRRRGALIPPMGRFLSRYLPPLYFVAQRMLPFSVGQLTTVLQKVA